jgi:hypothetical protein
MEALSNLSSESTVAKTKEAFRDKTGTEVEDQELYYKGRKLQDYEILKEIRTDRDELVLDVRLRSDEDTLETGWSSTVFPQRRKRILMTIGHHDDGEETGTEDDGDDDDLDDPRSQPRRDNSSPGPGRQDKFSGLGQIEPKDVGDVVKELMERWTTVAK